MNVFKGLKFSSSAICVFSFFLNLFLFLLKLFVGILFSSISILSDAFNSLVDIVSSIMIYISIRVGSKPADEDHQFGHSRAEPLAAYTISILTFVLSFELIRVSVFRIISGEKPEVGILPILVLIFVILIKSFIWFVIIISKKAESSPALKALALDSKMDLVISLLALGGVLGTYLGYPYLDAYAALLISFWIAKVGFEIGKENIEKLIGKKPNEKIMTKINRKIKILEKQKNIKDFYNLKVHYVGSDIHISVSLSMNKKSDLGKANELKKRVKEEIEKIREITNVEVNIDPV